MLVKKMKTLTRIIAEYSKWLSVVTLIFVTIATFLLVVLRYVFEAAAPEIDEMNGFVFVWFLYFSIIWCTTQNQHIRVNIIDLFLTPKLRKITDIIADILWGIFGIGMAYASISIVFFTISYQRFSTVLNIPWYMLYAILPLTFIAMTISITFEVINRIKNIFLQEKKG